jgi:hypothetical protein
VNLRRIASSVFFLPLLYLLFFHIRMFFYVFFSGGRLRR